MANVTVDATALITQGNRVVFRDANDRVYVFVNDSGTLRAYKGNVVGEPASFTEQTTGTPPIASGGTFIGISAAIDSAGLVTVICYFDDTAAHGSSDDIRSFGFRTSAHATSQDEWVDKNVEVAALARQDLIYAIGRLGVLVDGSDVAHALWIEGISDMGSVFSIVHHSRRSGGTWDTKTVVTPVSNNVEYNNFSAMIADPLSLVNADRPIVAAGGGNQIDVYYGNALAAISWTEQRDVTGSILVATGLVANISMAIDSNEKIVIAFIETTFDLMIVEHLNANAWTAWETSTDVDTSTDYLAPSITINGTNVFIFVEDSTNFDINLWKDIGAGFVEETTDIDLPNVGTFNDVKVKWSSKNNNSAADLDYVFEDSGGAVLYNTFSVSAVVTRTKTFTLDAVLKKEDVTKTFTLDAVLSVLATKTFTLDAILLAVVTKTFTLDTVLKKLAITKTFTLDAVLEKVFTKTFTLDAFLDVAVIPSDIKKNILQEMPYKTIPKHLIRTKQVIRAPIPVEVQLRINGPLFDKLSIKFEIIGTLKQTLSTGLKIRGKLTETIKVPLGIVSNLEDRISAKFEVGGKQSHEGFLEFLKQYLKSMEVKDEQNRKTFVKFLGQYLKYMDVEED